MLAIGKVKNESQEYIRGQKDDGVECDNGTIIAYGNEGNTIERQKQSIVEFENVRMDENKRTLNQPPPSGNLSCFVFLMWDS